MAMARGHTLNAIPTAHTTSASGFLKPFDNVSAGAHTTSNKPATISISQFMSKYILLSIVRHQAAPDPPAAMQVIGFSFSSEEEVIPSA